MEIGANTRLLAVLGDPVAHSLSPAMHNAAIRALGLDAVYVGLRVHAAALTDLLKTLTAVGAAGNVTVPHKEAVERHVARKTDACAKAGACNTFWVDDGVLVGDNTDVAAVRGALAALGADGAGRWLVIGTGGAARAVAIAAAAAGADLRVRSRAPERAKRFVSWAAERGTRAAVWKEGEATDVALNATRWGSPRPIPCRWIPRAWPACATCSTWCTSRGRPAGCRRCAPPAWWRRTGARCWCAKAPRRSTAFSRVRTLPSTSCARR